MDSHQVLKREIQLSKFKDLIGFIQGFMSQTASHIANTNGKERISEDLYKMEGFIGRWGWKKEASCKEWVVSGEAALHWGKAEVYQVNYFISPDQVNPNWLLKDHISGRGCN